MAYFLVTMAAGPDWNPERTRREQSGWDAHAQFMDGLVDQGLVVLAGPTGEDVDAGDALALVRAEDRGQAMAVFNTDPWLGSILTIESALRWNLWLGCLTE